jgi:xylosylprotein 4-beta-galactosyltransferase
VREVLAPSEGDGGAAASGRIADRTVDAAHLSPPGVHPEYVFRTFKGGAWLFTWDALVRADGYAHVYWGWGLEDDDLGARALAANLSVATRPFPVSTKNVSSASRRDVSRFKASRDRCTGFARACAFDPTRTDCLAGVPYDSFKKRAFAKTPRTTREGLIVPEGRTLADGVCFAHAHEGTFSRDALETNARRHPRLSPEFTRGRRWEDVRSGRFRADETTGLARLTPAGVLGDEGRDANGVSRTFEKRKKNAPPEDAPPDPGHGFAVLGLDVVGVRVRRGVAIVSNETRHPHPAVASVLDDPALKKHRWSGNALLRRAFGTSASTRERASSVAIRDARFAYPAFTRLRVRLTCDEDATPWCVDATRDAWRANENETRGEKTR